MNNIWREVIQPFSLKGGWHLTRRDIRSDFLNDPLVTEAFAFDLDAQIREISRQLETDTFAPKARIPIDIPKGTLGTRPGSHLALPDRVVLWAIIKKIAPIFEELLDDGVYSYRGIYIQH